MRAPRRRVHHTGYRRGAKDAGIGLSDQGRPTQQAGGNIRCSERELPQISWRGSGRGGKKSPALRWTLGGQREKGSRPGQGSLKRYDASAHRLLSRSGQGVVGVGPVRRQSIASLNAVSPGRSPNLGRGLYHPPPGHRADRGRRENGFPYTPLGDRAACGLGERRQNLSTAKDLTAE